ncbi:MAG: [acyl-carrier-protein] S-malonyltransferase [Trueperaceae bacterium]|jgi:[acyl-carrier-protein] S-malonyltransferase|nr:[acyl-carrier-protein] S-malonyltransferase [Trueperaceae bacterium]MCH2666882.1 ACP S-malonyltransferase [Deinococcales bacterium]|tara:strand:+ start:12370 stop:13296 length:927 start_codon:yes stop_codon:yes gene_type:complete
MNGKLAALFPGQGSQFVGMAKDLYNNHPSASQVLDEADATLPGLLQLMFSGPTEELQNTANQQPALVAAGAAAFAAYREAGGQEPDYAAGHSLGEYTAHVTAGSLPLSEVLRLVRKRGIYMQEAVPKGKGTMAAVLKISPLIVEQVCQETGGVVEPANFNSLNQTVISGEVKSVNKAAEILKEKGARVVPLKVSAPFHCSLMTSAAKRLAADLAEITFSEPSFGIVVNVTADLLNDTHEAADLLTQQVAATVRWQESLERLVKLGVVRFLEFGSGDILTKLVNRNIEGVEAKAVVDSTTVQQAIQEVT